MAASGQPESFETDIPLNSKYYKVYVYSPKKDYCITAFVDITEQKNQTLQERAEHAKSEGELRKHEKYRYLLNNAPTGIYEVEVNPLRFKHVNEIMCNILGYNESELLALDPLMLLYPASKKRFLGLLQKTNEGERIFEADDHIKKKDGRGVWCTLEIKFIYKEAKVNGALVVAHDVTQRRKTEQELAIVEKRYRRLFETTQDGIMAR